MKKPVCLFFAVLAVTGSPLWQLRAAEGPVRASSLANADAVCQRKIRDIVRNASKNADLGALLKERGIESAQDRADLIPQVLIFQLDVQNDERRLWQTVALLEVLLRGVSPEEAIRSLSPYLPTKVPELRDSLYEILDHFFLEGRKYHFDIAKNFVSSIPRQSLFALADYMFERSPGGAFQTFLASSPEIQEDRRHLLSSNAAPVLEFLKQPKSRRLACDKPEASLHSGLLFLANQEEWWVRKLVDRAITECPKLRTDTIVKALAKNREP